jgi:phage terminase large subunit GpA-like protein
MVGAKRGAQEGSCPGPWRNENNPALVGIMNVLSLWHVRVGVIQKGIQTGGSQALYNLLGMEGDYSNGHDNALVVMADEKSVRKNSKNRVQTIFRDSATLAPLLSPNPDDTGTYSIKLLSDFRIDIGWATSEVSLASESYRIEIIDELSKCKNLGNIEEAKGRTTTFEDTKRIWMVSSPDDEGTDPIEAELKQCEVIMDFQVACPNCGVLQVMMWEFFRWPEQKSLIPGQPDTSDPAEIRRKKQGRYQCPHCDDLWDDHKRDQALLAAMKREPFNGWVPHKAVERFSSVGFIYPSWYSRFVSLSEIIAKRLIAEEEFKKTGDDSKLKKWVNTMAGQQYRREIKDRKEDQILALADLSMPRGVVPENIYCLLLLVDTQQIGFYYEVVAFGWGKDLESWQIDHGFLEDFDQLKDLSEQRFLTAKGAEHGIQAAFIDSGGGTNPARPKHTRTKEVYEFCSDNRLFRPIKGSRDGAPWRITRLDYYPSREGKKVPIPGGLNLYTINVTMFKNQLSGKLKLNPNAPGAFHLHADSANDTSYAKQMCAEYQDERGYYICPPGKPNHFWDIATYRFAAADIMRIRTKSQPKEAPPPQAAAARPTVTQSGRLPSWFTNRR